MPQIKELLNETQLRLKKGLPIFHRLSNEIAINHFRTLSHEERKQFIVAKFFEHKKPKELAKAIAEKYPEFKLELTELGFGFQVNLVDLAHQILDLKTAKKSQKPQNELDERRTNIAKTCARLFITGTPEEKRKLMIYNFFGVDIETYTKTIDNLVSVIDIKELVSFGLFYHLVAAGYFKKLINSDYILSILSTGYGKNLVAKIGFDEIISQLRKLDIKENYNGEENYYLTSGIRYLLNTNKGYFQELYNLGYIKELKIAIGNSKFRKLEQIYFASSKWK